MDIASKDLNRHQFEFAEHANTANTVGSVPSVPLALTATTTGQANSADFANTVPSTTRANTVSNATHAYITDNTVSANNTTYFVGHPLSYFLLASQPLFYTRVSPSVSQLNSANATPILMLPNPGVGKFIAVRAISFTGLWNNYTIKVFGFLYGNNPSIRYAFMDDGNGVMFGGNVVPTMWSTFYTMRMGLTQTVDTSIVNNAPIYMWQGVALDYGMRAGSVIYVHLFYHVVTL